MLPSQEELHKRLQAKLSRVQVHKFRFSVSLYVCIYRYNDIHIHTCMHAYIHTYESNMCIFIDTCMYISTYVHRSVHKYVHI